NPSINGDVLITGGYNSNNGVLRGADLYNPATNTWSAAPDTTMPRYGDTATLLPNGKVLLVGHGNALSAELYDPISGGSQAGTIGELVADDLDVQTATLLTSGSDQGKVLV